MGLEGTYDTADQLLLKVNTTRGILDTLVLGCCMPT